jgi:hypothetical protein
LYFVSWQRKLSVSLLRFVRRFNQTLVQVLTEASGRAQGVEGEPARLAS